MLGPVDPRDVIYTRDALDRSVVGKNATSVSQDCIQTITTLSWPAGSPDLSPIKHIWDHLGRKVGNPMSLNELEARLQQVWNEMSQDIIQNLYA
ncbi:transposable element Tcb2 transposase [Trichonephila clavipes]|nr:transposable element Tcb2 transposase [Trichonephila clavipes]